MMPITYNPHNWFWFVAGDQTRVYASALGDYISVTDPTYLAWLASGGVTTPIDSVISLGDVLGRVLAPRPVDAAVLDAYKEGQSNKFTPVDVVPKVCFFIYNEVRDLQGKPPLTFAQFRQAIKDKM